MSPHRPRDRPIALAVSDDVPQISDATFPADVGDAVPYPDAMEGHSTDTFMDTHLMLSDLYSCPDDMDASLIPHQQPIMPQSAPIINDDDIVPASTPCSGAQRCMVRSAQQGCLDERMLIYDAVQSSQLPNFMHCRLPLPTATNIPTWRAWLEDYHDNIICDYMEFGWPIGYMADDLPQTVSQNHTSSIAYPHHVDHFLAVELQHSALLGPFPNTHPPFTFVATSPLMSRPKKKSEHRRIIMNFSFPIGSSVNSGIPKDTYLGIPYKLHYPTVDDYVRLILHNGVGCMLYKVDLARAFRMMPTDPLDYPLLGISWNDKIYINTAIGFGLRTGSMICQRITDAIGYIMGQRYGAKTLQYVDDCVGVERNDAMAMEAYTNLRRVISSLGLQEASDKLCPPSTCMEFIGITFDTVTSTISIPANKIAEIMALVRTWQGRSCATKHQSLLGKLHHVSKCVKPARLFVSRMLDTLRSAPDRGRVALDADFQRDLQWFANFLPTYNGRNMMQYVGLSMTDYIMAGHAIVVV